VTMGWLKLNREQPKLQHGIQISLGLDSSLRKTTGVPCTDILLDGSLAMKDYVGAPTQQLALRQLPVSKRYLPVSLSVRESELPVIPHHEMKLRAAQKDTLPDEDVWIVIDNIIYDCTAFMEEHPGGRSIIQSFKGEDCSWQFWRIHTKDHLEEFGRELRIGRCQKGTIQNRYAEVPRYVGLRSLSEMHDNGF
jgi:cytochrome b involved in lipid metabolism